VSAADGADAPPRSRCRAWSGRLWWAALILVGTLAVITAGLLRPGGSIQADRTEHVPQGSLAALPALEPGAGLEQRFEADADGLSQVSVRFGTYARTGTGTVVVRLDTAEGEPVAAATIPRERLRDAVIMSVAEMAPRAGSAGRSYRLRISLSADTSSAVTLFGLAPTDTEPAARRTDDQPATLAIEVHTDYGHDRFALDQVGTALRRMGEYGPFWRRGLFVALLALGSVALLAGVALAPRRRGLALLLVFVVVKGVLWSVIIPPMMGPDEGAHVAYAQFMAVDHAIPKRDAPRGTADTYSEQLRAAAGIFHSHDLPRSDRADYDAASVTDARPRLGDAGGRDESNGTGPAAGYSPVYYAIPTLIYAVTPGGLDVQVGAMRLWSVALGAVAVLFAVYLGRLLFPVRESAALLLGAGVALHPMLSQQTAVVNNDALTIAAGAACAYYAVALIGRDRSRWVPAFAGLAFGLGLLAKPLGIAFAPAIFVAWVIGRRRGCRGGVVATYGLWVVFAAAFGYAGVGIQDTPGAGGRGLRDFLHLVRFDNFALLRLKWIDQFWGDFGWVNTPYPAVVHGVLVGAVLVAAVLVVAWGVVFVRDLVLARQGRGPLLDPVAADLAAATAVCVLILAATLAELHLVMYEWYVRAGDLAFIQGRYALMVVPVVLVLPVLALRRLVPRLTPLVPLGTVAAAMGLLNFIAIGLIVERFYL
jgi:hypothetical protein